jgi:uncharacterized protein GlcG (DUF336 family)
MTLLSLQRARKMIDISIAAADCINVACLNAITASTGHLLAFVRQDTAMSGSAERAISKAFIA